MKTGAMKLFDHFVFFVRICSQASQSGFKSENKPIFSGSEMFRTTIQGDRIRKKQNPFQMKVSWAMRFGQISSTITKKVQIFKISQKVTK